MVNWGIIGFGLHGDKRLMPGFARSRNCRVTAIQRRHPEKARTTAQRYSIPHAFTSVEEICKSADVDAVLVTSPNSLHLDEVLAAFRFGKHVLCEKPLAMNADEASQMVTAAKKAGKQFGVAHVFRFCQSVNLIRDRLGEIGVPAIARADFSYFAPPNHPRSWLTNRSVAGGGPLADVGVHCIDTLRYILRDEVVRISAVGAKDALSGDVESAAALSIEFLKGTVANVAVSIRAEYHTVIEIRGDRGAFNSTKGLAVDFPVTVELWRENKIFDQQTVFNELAYAFQVDEFADAIEGKAMFRAPGEEGWQNQVILDAAYRSIASGKTEEVSRVT